MQAYLKFTIRWSSDFSAPERVGGCDKLLFRNSSGGQAMLADHRRRPSAKATVLTWLVSLAATVCSATGAWSGDATGQAASKDRWQLSFAPYGWITWLDGDQTIRGRKVEVEVDPITLVEHLESVPFMGYSEARKGPLAIYGDLVYANLGLDGSSIRSRSIHPAITGTLSTSLGLEIKQAIAEVGGAYEIARWPSGANGSTAIDILAGARYWHQQASLNFALNVSLDVGDLVISRGIAIARGGSVDWVDPVIGGRIRHRLGPGQELVLRGDVGGFGVGSEFSWNVLGTYGFEICQQDGVTYSGILGYRALDVDYEKGFGRNRYEYNVLQHGPLTGLTISF